MMRSLSTRAFVIAIGLALGTAAHAKQEDGAIDFVTFNMKWFGARYDNPRADRPTPVDPAFIRERARQMKRFFDEVVKPTDVGVFEEVVDVEMLQSVLPHGWDCISYHSDNQSHQKVVVCAAGEYRLVDVPYDNNTTIEEVASASDSEWSRPAVRVDLTNRNGARIARIVGAHLKAMPFYSRERARQMRAIAKDLRSAGRAPVIVTGDLNTYWKGQTNQSLDDIVALTSRLQEADSTFRHLDIGRKNTYRSNRYKSQFDHILVNDKIEVASAPEIYPVCDQRKNGTGFRDFNFYYRYISDHCPVRFKFRVK